jgi:hypothetical protein
LNINLLNGIWSKWALLLQGDRKLWWGRFSIVDDGLCRFWKS